MIISVFGKYTMNLAIFSVYLRKKEKFFIKNNY